MASRVSWERRWGDESRPGSQNTGPKSETVVRIAGSEVETVTWRSVRGAGSRVKYRHGVTDDRVRDSILRVEPTQHQI